MASRSSTSFFTNEDLTLIGLASVRKSVFASSVRPDPTKPRESDDLTGSDRKTYIPDAGGARVRRANLEYFLAEGDLTLGKDRR
jgi:hypothetical protein